MKFGLSLSFIFNDDYWFKKVTLPTLCGLIPIIGQIIILGWSLKVALNVIQGVKEPLPDLDFIEDLKRGLFAWAINLLYTMPILLLSLILQWRPFITVESTRFIVNEMSTGTAILSGIVVLLYFFIYIFTQPATMNYLAKNDFKAAFKFDEVWQLFSQNPGDWVLAFLATTIIGLLLAPLGLLICFIGILFVGPITSAATAHLMGQAYLRSQNKSQTPEMTAG